MLHMYWQGWETTPSSIGLPGLTWLLAGDSRLLTWGDNALIFGQNSIVFSPSTLELPKCQSTVSRCSQHHDVIPGWHQYIREALLGQFQFDWKCPEITIWGQDSPTQKHPANWRIPRSGGGLASLNLQMIQISSSGDKGWVYETKRAIVVRHLMQMWNTVDFKRLKEKVMTVL